MARVKLSPLLTDISGSIGGMTIQRNKFGMTLRQKPIPLNKLTTAQSVVRQHIIAIQAAWQGLTDAQRLQWDRFIDFSGQTINRDRSVRLSGHGLYLKYQLYRLMSGFSLLTTITYIPMPAVPGLSNLVDMGSTVTIGFPTTVDVSEYFFFVALSNPRQASKSYSGRYLRICTTPYPPSDNANYDIKSSYESAFGATPLTGSYIHYSILWFSVKAPVFTSRSTGILISS